MVLERFQLWALSKPSYWRWRNRLGYFVFRLRRANVTARRVVGGAKDVAVSRAGILRVAFRPVVWGFLVVAALEVGRFAAVEGGVAWPLLRDSTDGSAQTVGLGVAGIGGTLLGLYFTALTVVLSGAYVTTTAGVRRRFFLHREGHSYASAVTTTVIASLLVAIGDMVGHKPSVMTVVVVTAFGACAAGALLHAGSRAFGLMDPVGLGDPIRADLRAWAKRATYRAFSSRDRSFQAYYHQRAALDLTELADLTHLVIARTHRDDAALQRLVVTCLETWRTYAIQKLSIPLDSLWHRTSHRHVDWLTVDGGNTRIALRTGTALQPEELRDTLWFETELLPPLRAALLAVTKSRDIDATATCLLNTNSLLEALGSLLQLDEALLLWRSVVDTLSKELKGSGSSGDHESWRLMVADFLMMLPVGLLLAVVKRLETIGPGFVRDRVMDVLQSRFRGQHGPAVFEDWLQKLSDGASFEVATVGFRSTPDWWCVETAASRMVRFSSDALPRIGREAIELLGAHAESWKHQPSVAATVAFRCIELSKKLDVHADTVSRVCKAVGQCKTTTGGVWPGVDGPSIAKLVDALQQVATRVLVDMTPRLAPATDLVGRAPDTFGRAYKHLVDIVFKTIVNRDDKSIGLQFRALFAAGVKAFLHLRARVDANSERALEVMILATEPLADLLELSGYALLLAEAGHRPMYDVVTATWTAALMGEQQSLAKILEVALSAREQRLFDLRGAARIERAQEFWPHVLSGRTRRGYRDSRGEDSHASVLFHVVAESAGMFDVMEAFVLDFLAQRGFVAMSGRVRRLHDAIAREAKRRKEDS